MALGPHALDRSFHRIKNNIKQGEQGSRAKDQQILS